jgi:hypothetical protein
MPERLEKYSIIFAAIVQIFAVGWWVSALSESVNTLEQVTKELAIQVSEIDERAIRLEERYKFLAEGRE